MIHQADLTAATVADWQSKAVELPTVFRVPPYFRAAVCRPSLAVLFPWLYFFPV